MQLCNFATAGMSFPSEFGAKVRKLKQPNLRGCEGANKGVVFDHFLQNDHYFENQKITQNSGLKC